MTICEMNPVVPEVVQINIGDVKITFLNKNGEPLKPGEMAQCFRWKIEGAGIDPIRVISVQIPKLDYMDSSPVTLTVEMSPTNLAQRQR
jgi:type IV pilus biogenesis protein CpaD/CtpE